MIEIIPGRQQAQAEAATIDRVAIRQRVLAGPVGVAGPLQDDVGTGVGVSVRLAEPERALWIEVKVDQVVDGFVLSKSEVGQRERSLGRLCSHHTRSSPQPAIFVFSPHLLSRHGC